MRVADGDEQPLVRLTGARACACQVEQHLRTLRVVGVAEQLERRLEMARRRVVHVHRERLPARLGERVGCPRRELGRGRPGLAPQ
jgi:hypothetical protein